MTSIFGHFSVGIIIVNQHVMHGCHAILWVREMGTKGEAVRIRGYHEWDTLGCFACKLGAVWRAACILQVSCGTPQNSRYWQDIVSHFRRYWQNQKLVFSSSNILFFFEILYAGLLPIMTNPRYSKFAVSQLQIVSRRAWPHLATHHSHIVHSPL
jgi:hypothetical protein